MKRILASAACLLSVAASIVASAASPASANTVQVPWGQHIIFGRHCVAEYPPANTSPPDATRHGVVCTWLEFKTEEVDYPSGTFDVPFVRSVGEVSCQNNSDNGTAKTIQCAGVKWTPGLYSRDFGNVFSASSICGAWFGASACNGSSTPTTSTSGRNRSWTAWKPLASPSWGDCAPIGEFWAATTKIHFRLPVSAAEYDGVNVGTAALDGSPLHATQVCFNADNSWSVS